MFHPELRRRMEMCWGGGFTVSESSSPLHSHRLPLVNTRREDTQLSPAGLSASLWKHVMNYICKNVCIQNKMFSYSQTLGIAPGGKWPISHGSDRGNVTLLSLQRSIRLGQAGPVVPETGDSFDIYTMWGLPWPKRGFSSHPATTSDMLAT